MKTFCTSFGTATSMYDPDITPAEYAKIVSLWLGLKQTKGKWEQDWDARVRQEDGYMGEPQCHHDHVTWGRGGVWWRCDFCSVIGPVI
ncbi:MAG: hypothetical protein GTO63_07950 [Anaerolineae bacterium]|nr:hypothetical protein [Anaerolineae bacterium]NIN94862.1 hypothetical protein [Anaerolineae bacterium]NIQ77913.1 hypothetical protein [Anaerolineae bacterium]